MSTLGFTGTRQGLVAKQRGWLEGFLSGSDHAVVVHGGCVGADAEFHDLALRLTSAVIVVLPGDKPDATMPREDNPRVTWIAPSPPLARNERIVEVCDLLLATPAQGQMILRSGTWATVRRAVKHGREVVLIGPDGEFEL